MLHSTEHGYAHIANAYYNALTARHDKALDDAHKEEVFKEKWGIAYGLKNIRTSYHDSEYYFIDNYEEVDYRYATKEERDQALNDYLAKLESVAWSKRNG